MELYAGANHGFAVPDTAVYNKDAAEKHWAAVGALFAQTLRA
jgi:carboxymethylenebutenolidase